MARFRFTYPPSTLEIHTHLLTLERRAPQEGAIATPAASAKAHSGGGATFAELGIPSGLVKLLRNEQITMPSPIQAMSLPDALAGRDICGKARTGSGKTLAFGLPVVLANGQAKPGQPVGLVLVPTRELATQIATALLPLAESRGRQLATVFGGVPINRQVQRLRNGADIIIATPGRLNDLLLRGALNLDRLGIVVLDEADQMADMGFMPQVERILKQITHEHQTLLFSATLDGVVDRLVKRYQVNPVFHAVDDADEGVPTMTHRFIGMGEDEKVAAAATIAAGPERTLIFVRRQRDAMRLVKNLEAEGLEAGMLHGGLSQPRRERALATFAREGSSVLVATNIAARGIHVDDIGIVLHFDPPEDAKTYIHRAGRTARAGAEGLVVTLAAPDQMSDVAAVKRIAGLTQQVVPMKSSDPRLRNLWSWPAPDDLAAAHAASHPAPPRHVHDSPKRRQGRTIDTPRAIPHEAHNAQGVQSMSYTDKLLECVDCRASFSFTAGEQEFHASKGFSNEPRRCPNCRGARRNDTGGGGGYGQRREMFTVTCSSCGKDAQVPFEPRGDRPVYCSDCFKPQPRSGGSSYGSGGYGGGGRRY